MKLLIKPPLPGKILHIPVREGQKVKKGEVLFVLESMKMHNNILSECDGIVTRVMGSENTAVSTDKDILEIQKL